MRLGWGADGSHPLVSRGTAQKRSFLYSLTPVAAHVHRRPCPIIDALAPGEAARLPQAGAATRRAGRRAGRVAHLACPSHEPALPGIEHGGLNVTGGVEAD